MKPVAILTPTLRRPDSLEAALRSAFALHRLAELTDEIVVVDNDPEASAAAVVERLRAVSPVPLTYVHARKPGVSTARNAGLAGVRAPHVAFLDDDEIASPEWLDRLYEGHLRFGADVTFGATRGVAAGAKPSERAYLDRFFSRTRPEPSGPIPDTHDLGCGNSIMRRATALSGPGPFETAADDAGGEDDRLFARIRAAGGGFAYVADAWLDEVAPPHRARAGYVVARAFAFGQGPTRGRLRRDPPDRLGAFGWMAVGVAQAALFGPAALVLRALGRPLWLPLAVRAAEGLGKASPWKEMNFYGAAMLAAASRPARRPPWNPLRGLGRPSAHATATSITQVKSL